MLTVDSAEFGQRSFFITGLESAHNSKVNVEVLVKVKSQAILDWLDFIKTVLTDPRVVGNNVFVDP